ncbi:hypothetical protein BDV38DRAFT_280270 [Aspergillus pseudotamarii]|uniref:Uncharacterized protein n=1 Tax=Aspergillus pseudotamarii TaxID=132259 RepID=A0A5N6T1V7_ASPPS|nr:uncharacterized protein BDV38DRAFT_280270 [Aspergillus pseudotamarii]KAE8140274.1 hypothetical protein BDV38DRAFT_280270 [Aspergillus pseudotamarii]
MTRLDPTSQKHPLDLYKSHDVVVEVYTDLQTVVGFIREYLESFLGGGEQYMAITQVSDADLLEFNKWRACTRPRTFLVRAFPAYNTLVMKFKSPLCDQLSATMYQRFYIRKYQQHHGLTSDILSQVGPTIYTTRNGLQLEAEQAYIPLTSREPDSYPSLVMEFGDRTSLHALRVDARLWLENTSGLTRFVLVVAFSTGEIVLECWEYGDGVAECTHEVSVDYQSGRVRHAPLMIPLERILDEMPDLPGITEDATIAFSDDDLISLMRETIYDETS